MRAKTIGGDTQAADRAFVRAVSARFDDFGIYPIGAPAFEPGVEPSIAKLRRARRGLDEIQGIGYMSLVETDGVLRWELGTGPAPSRRGGPRRAARAEAGRAPSITVHRQYKFKDLPPNEIGGKLRQLDGTLTKLQGLREVARDTLRVGGETVPVRTGRILLFVHGTFSSVDHLLAEITATPDGKRLLERALKGKQYGQVLAFNHPTLSVSPLLNAAELAQHFRGSGAEVDVVCHSRGGLVTRWWLEVLDHAAQPRGRVVFAGSPLAGTSLAAPARLRAALDLLTNISRALGEVATRTGLVCPVAAPLGQAAGILFSLFGKLTALAAKTPIVDAGVAMIPGLAGQSREGANAEILRLRSSFETPALTPRARQCAAGYYFLTSNFEPTEAGWRFWRYFRKDQLLDTAADFIFDGPNDLVVDTASMTSLADVFGLDEIPADRIERFGGTSAAVHHLNYFQQPEAIQLLKTALQL